MSHEYWRKTLTHRDQMSTLLGRNVGLVTALFLAGNRVPLIVMCTVLGVWIAGNVGARFLPFHEARAIFFGVFRIAFFVLPLVGVAACFVAGCWLRLISRGTLVLAAAIVAAMFAAARLAGFTSEPAPCLLALWACCLTPAALAAAPLAVWWNRHR